jgi:hypothetical protein
MGKLRCRPAEITCLWRNISHRKVQKHFSVGKKSGRPAKRHGLPGRFSHRNLKIHFLWENSAAGLQKTPARAEDFPIETKKKYFSVGKNCWQYLENFCLSKNFSHRNLE